MASRGNDIASEQRACRNILRAPGFVNLDLGLSRDFRVGEPLRVQVRGEAFHLFNHSNFVLPAMAVGNPQQGLQWCSEL